MGYRRFTFNYIAQQFSIICFNNLGSFKVLMPRIYTPSLKLYGFREGNEEQLFQLVVKFGKCLTLIFMCELDLLIK